MTMTLSGTGGITFPSTAVQPDAAVGTGGQTWQNLTASRAYNTTYTNSTGKAIFISVSCANAQAQSMIINSATTGVCGAMNLPFTYLIPNGATYAVNCGATLNLWYELR